MIKVHHADEDTQVLFELSDGSKIEVSITQRMDDKLTVLEWKSRQLEIFPRGTNVIAIGSRGKEVLG